MPFTLVTRYQAVPLVLVGQATDQDEPVTVPYTASVAPCGRLALMVAVVDGLARSKVLLQAA